MGVASTAFGYEGSVVVHRPPATHQPRSSACAEPRSCPSRWSRTPLCCLLPIRSPKVSRTSSGAVPYAWRPPDLVGGRGRDPVDRGGEVGADPCAGEEPALPSGCRALHGASHPVAARPARQRRSDAGVAPFSAPIAPVPRTGSPAGTVARHDARPDGPDRNVGRGRTRDARGADPVPRREDAPGV